jgi:hypothetical protein
MTEYALGPTQITRTLDLLAAERARLRRRYRWFWLHRAMVYVLVVSLVLLVLAFLLVGNDVDASGPVIYALGGLSLAMMGSFFAIVPLFFVNLPFAWRLFKHDQLRRRLRLSPEIHAQIRESIRKRPLMALLSVLGSIVAVAAMVFVLDQVLGRASGTMALNAEIWLSICIGVVGLSVPTLWLMARAVDRLETVARLHTQLEQGRDSLDSGSIQVSAADYERLAHLEKRRTIEARERSVRKGIKLTKAPIYAVQRSIDVQAAIEQLQADTRLGVEQAIFDLMTAPRSRKAAPLADSALLAVPVPETSLELHYEVDDQASRIRLHRLQFQEQRAS